MVSIVPLGTVAQQDVQQEKESNDTRENAISLNFVNTPVEGITRASVSGYNNQSSPARFGPGDEEDWYSFQVEAGQVVRAWGHGARRANITATLVGPDGEVLTGLDFRTDSVPQGVVAKESGTYFIHVMNGSGNSAVARPILYNFVIQMAEEIQLEPNNNPDSGTSIIPGETIVTTLVEGVGVDWYVVHADSGTTINATLRSLTYKSGGPPVAALIHVGIYDDDGNRISKPVDLSGSGSVVAGAVNRTYPYIGTTEVAVVAKSVEEGTYYIRVSGLDGLTGIAFAPYSLTVSGEGLEKVGEGNETTSTPTPTPTPTHTLSPTATATRTPTETLSLTSTSSLTPTTTATQIPRVTTTATLIPSSHTPTTITTDETPKGRLLQTTTESSTDGETGVFGPGFSIGGVVVAMFVVIMGLLSYRQQ